MSKRRVVVTGLGVVSPVGNDVKTAWDTVTAGKSGIVNITRFDTTDQKQQHEWHDDGELRRSHGIGGCREFPYSK